MTAKPSTCYTFVCDDEKCGGILGDGGEYIPHFTAPDDAVAVIELDNWEWVVASGRHWHRDCAPLCSCGHMYHHYGCDGETDGGGACLCKEYLP